MATTWRDPPQWNKKKFILFFPFFSFHLKRYTTPLGFSFRPAPNVSQDTFLHPWLRPSPSPPPRKIKRRRRKKGREPLWIYDMSHSVCNAPGQLGRSSQSNSFSRPWEYIFLFTVGSRPLYSLPAWAWVKRTRNLMALWLLLLLSCCCCCFLLFLWIIW